MVVAETLTVSFLKTARPLANAIAFKRAQFTELTHSNRSPTTVDPKGYSITVEPKSKNENSYEGISVKRTLADKAVKQLMAFYDFNENWDGNGAEEPIGSSIDEAKAFVRCLSPESLIPKPALHADGHVMLFLNHDDLYVEIEFLEDKQISYYAKRGNTEWSEQVHFDGRSLSQNLSEIGFAIS